MASVLLTGALGYIGSAVSVELRAAGHDVTGLDDATSSRVTAIDGVDLWEYSVTSRVVGHLVEQADAVIHLAAFPGIDNCARQPLAAIDANIRGTLNVLEACADHRVPLVFGSTIGVYDAATVDVIDGTNPRDAPTFYAQTKRTGEDAIAAVANQRFLPAIAFQMGNLYGAHKVDGIRVTKPTAINQFIGQARAGEPIEVHEPGAQTRDFVHVGDVARAYRLAIERIHDVAGMVTLPLASGDLYCVEEVAEWAADAGGVALEYVDHPGEPRWVQQIDIGRTRRFLDWDPTHSAKAYVEGALDD